MSLVDWFLSVVLSVFVHLARSQQAYLFCNECKREYNELFIYFWVVFACFDLSLHKNRFNISRHALVSFHFIIIIICKTHKSRNDKRVVTLTRYVHSQNRRTTIRKWAFCTFHLFVDFHIVRFAVVVLSILRSFRIRSRLNVLLHIFMCRNFIVVSIQLFSVRNG